MHAFSRHVHAFQGAVAVVVKIIDAYRTPEAAAIGLPAAIVVNKIRLAFKIDNSLVVGVAVAGQFVQDALKFPRAVDVAAHGVGNFLRKLVRKREVIPALALVYPRRFGKLW